jgi:hypothetical protein
MAVPDGHGMVPQPVRVVALSLRAFSSDFPMQPLDANEFLIVGMTIDGRQFRPSDWSERLTGVMSQFRPGGPQPGSHLGYSPWCHPVVRNGVKCVVVHRDLREHDVMAWDFCVNFARDNQLQVEVGRSVSRQKSATPAPDTKKPP